MGQIERHHGVAGTAAEVPQSSILGCSTCRAAFFRESALELVKRVAEDHPCAPGSNPYRVQADYGDAEGIVFDCMSSAWLLCAVWPHQLESRKGQQPLGDRTRRN